MVNRGVLDFGPLIKGIGKSLVAQRNVYNVCNE